MHWSKPSVGGDIPTQGIRSHSATLVPQSNSFKFFILGGNETPTDSHLLTFDPDTMFWLKPQVTGAVPKPQQRAQSATLVDNNRLFVFGGGDSTTYFDHLYVLDTNTLHWTKPDCSGQIPSARRAHSSVLIGRKLFIFGGGDGQKALNETYTLDVDKMQWELIKTKGEIPSTRGYHSSALIENKMWVFGGSDGQECFSDVSILDPVTATWSKKKLSQSCPCFAHSGTQIGPFMAIFGGHGASTYTNSLKFITVDSRIDVLEVKEKIATGVPPSVRGYHTSILHDSRLFVIGGYDGKKCHGDTHILDLGIYSHIAN